MSQSVEESTTVMESDAIERALSVKLTERSGGYSEGIFFGHLIGFLLGIVTILSDFYEVREQEARAELSYSCTNGKEYTTIENMAIKANRFENIHVQPILREEF